MLVSAKGTFPPSSYSRANGFSRSLISNPWAKGTRFVAWYGACEASWCGALQLVVPKHHGAKLTDIPDDQLEEILVRKSFERACSGVWMLMQRPEARCEETCSGRWSRKLQYPTKQWPASTSGSGSRTSCYSVLIAWARCDVDSNLLGTFSHGMCLFSRSKNVDDSGPWPQ